MVDIKNLSQLPGPKVPGFLLGAESSDAAFPSLYPTDNLIPISVSSFGAKGDGVTDDTVAIQAAINYAITVQAAVYFAPGVYVVNSTIYLPDDITNQYKSFGLIGDVASSWSSYGANCSVTILSSASDLFKTKTAPVAAGGLRSVSFTIRNINFKSTVYSTSIFAGATVPTAVCFSSMTFLTCVIQNCGFYNWGTVILGAINGRTVIRDNNCASVQFLKIDTNSTTRSADSLITGNYFNGMGGTTAGLQQVPNVDISDSNSVTVSQNYIDYSFIGVRVGGSNNYQLVINNIFDICYSAVRHVFGYPQVIINDNEFYRIGKTYNTSLSAIARSMINSTTFGSAIDLTTANWMCIEGFDQRMGNVIAANNMYGDANVFMQLATKGNWNIKESNNIGTITTTGLPAPTDQIVRFTGRQIDTTNYPVDNTAMSISAWQGQLNTDLRATQAVYPGLEYYVGSPPIKVYVNTDYSLSDQDGGFLFNKTNLLPTGTTNFNDSYQFTVTGATDVTAGAVYSTGGNNYTVVSFNLTSGAGSIIASGPAVPAANGTLTRVSGSGPSTISFSASAVSTAWVFNSPPAISNVGGVFTAVSGSGWSYIPLALAAGTYMVCLNVTSIGPTTNNYVSVGASLAISPSTYNQNATSCSLEPVAGSGMNKTGRAFYLIKPSGATARLGIYVPGGTNTTINYINIIQIA